MTVTAERFDESISEWLEETAPGGIPPRVLEVTFDRTRGSRQQGAWSRPFERSRMTDLAPVLGGAAVVIVAAALALRLLPDRTAVLGPAATPDPRTPFIGTWVSTSDADGGTQTMTVQDSREGGIRVVVTDDVASVCAGAPSTMTGTGSIDGKTLLIPRPAYACDDGSEPHALSGSSLQEQLRDLTFVLDARGRTLTDGFGGVWLREAGAAAAPTRAAPTSALAASHPTSEAGDGAVPNGFLQMGSAIPIADPVESRAP